MKFSRAMSFSDLGRKSLVRHLSTFSNDFFPETNKPVSIRFQMQSSGKQGKNVYIFGAGHMTKMTAMPIYERNFKQSSFSEPVG